MVATQTTNNTEEAKRRFRAVHFIQRNTSRATRRAVAAGAATRRGASTLGHKTLNQITAPYSGLKQTLGALMLVSGGVALWYFSIVVGIAMAGATGSVILAILGAVAFYMVAARLIYLPVVNAFMVYYTNAAMVRAPKATWSYARS